MYRLNSYNPNWQIGLITAIFVTAATVISGLVTYSIFEMRRASNVIDDRRTFDAAEAAVRSLQQKLAATVKDNAVWDDAYAAMQSVGAGDWAYENWGETSKDYELYDGALVTRGVGTVVAAYWKGKPFDPFVTFGETFDQQVRLADRVGAEPVLSFERVGDSVLLFGSLAVQPYADAVTTESFNVLTFFKEISPDVVEQISSEHQIRDLAFVAASPASQMLQLPLNNINGETIAHLQWSSEMPGTKVYHEVLGYLVSAFVLFLLFLAGILIAGIVERSRLRRVAAREKWNANHDRLSGLRNRAGLIETLRSRAWRARATSSLHLLDLDGFKQVNDAWGHAVGDELIKLVAERLLRKCGEETAVARLGGDEFAILKFSEHDAMSFSEELIAEIAEPFLIGGRTIEIGASIGFVFADPDVEPLELLRRADMSLYRAKEGGRRRAVEFSKELDDERDRLSGLEGQLRTAIHDGSIQPVFQPLVSASSGRISGVEALARWKTRAGSISPEIFIPLAERAGLIDALGLRMLELAIKTARPWKDLELSVNVSPIQLCNPSFPSLVIELLRREGFNPAQLTLEITEGVLMARPELSKRTMEALRKEGVKFALDDFGCGYASIGALREFGFERMKIDKSLVWASDDPGQGHEVLEATIALASALKIPVTAEGVETSRQAHLLRTAGCQLLQGYLVGKPMTADALQQMLEGIERAA